jgi:hypothetical protein
MECVLLVINRRNLGFAAMVISMVRIKRAVYRGKAYSVWDAR